MMLDWLRWQRKRRQLNKLDKKYFEWVEENHTNVWSNGRLIHLCSNCLKQFVAYGRFLEHIEECKKGKRLKGGNKK